MKVNVNGKEISMVPTQLIKLSAAELIEIHNELYPDAKPLKAWRTAKTKLVAKIMADFDAPDEKPAKPAKKKAKPAKAKTKKAPAVRKPSKSMRMLEILQTGSPQSIEDLCQALDTSVGSIRSYVSYFRKGTKGHDVVPMFINGGEVHLGEKPAKPAPEPKAKPAKAKAKTKKAKKSKK